MSPLPFAHTDRRTIWLRTTLLAATFGGLVASTPVWLNTRSFPLLPLFAGFPILPPPCDKLLYGGMLASLIAALWFYRPAVITFLATSLLAYAGDQNRGQPWLYMYWVLFLLSLFPAPVAPAAGRLSIAIVYLWSGVQKLNVRFFEVTPNWFVAPAHGWPLPEFAIPLLKLAVQSAPFVEIAIALLLWFPRTRRVAFGLAVVTHGFALLFLGPLGHDYNWVVWPWNLAMISLVFGFFARWKWLQTNTVDAGRRNNAPAESIANPSVPTSASFSLQQTWAELRRNWAATSIVALFGLLPILSYSGRWDSYFSFSLYSENLAVANVFVTESFRDRLPAHLKPYVEKFPPAFDPEHQGPLLFVFPKWAYDNLQVPGISEPRNFVNVYRALQPYAPTPSDLRMIIGPRSGPVEFHEGDRVEYLQRAESH